MFIAYQMMFAIITPALITGAFTNRVTFRAYMLFLTAWLLLVYFPFVHMIWGGGLLAQNGVLDFAGGIVVHAIAGTAALASVIYVGRRRTADSGPHSIPLVALGTGLLWFGWYGFNAGSEFRVDSVTAVAFLNTDVAASFAAIVWLAIDWSLARKPKFLGLLTGAVAGLATITPAAGYVSPITAIIIGCAAGAVCYGAVALKNRLKLDDALDVWGVHGVGGSLGIVLLGVFASKAWNPAGADGLLAGNPSFFFARGRGGHPRERVGVRLHLRDAVPDRSRREGPGERRDRGRRPRCRPARRGGLRRHLTSARVRLRARASPSTRASRRTR